MANTNGSLKRLLKPEQIEKIRKTQEELKDVKASLAMMERMGMDTSPIKEKIEWIDQMQTIMLEEYEKK